MSKILKLEVRNFRNLTHDLIEFSPKINCIFGKNGNGKTNILEAIYFLLNKKSFRKNSEFSDLLNIDTEDPNIYLSALIDQYDETSTLSLKINSKEAIWSFNGQITKKGIDLKSVLVSPFDAFNFYNTPQFRRTFIDFHLSLINPTYKKEISKYNKLLKFKNRLLADKSPDYRSQIEAINTELVPIIFSITNERLEFLKEINKRLKEIYKMVFSESLELTLSMKSDFFGKSVQEIAKILEEQRTKDEIIGHSTKGIHRDDYEIFINGLSAFDYASLGQQKMSYLGLLFAYIELFWYKFSVYPIILIDDISGELDMERWGRLVNYLEASKFQVLITTANHHFKEQLESISGIKKIEVNEGKVKNL